MSTAAYGVPPPQRAPLRYVLNITQQPERAKVVTRGKEKDRKPIDPPPVVQLFREGDTPGSGQSLYFHNPYIFCTVLLWHPERDEPKVDDNKSGNLPPLLGNCSSALNKLKDLNNSDGAFFVFSDISATISGQARLKFDLREYRPHENQIIFHKSQFSEVFEVMTTKDWDGPKESTQLSRAFADQGVRLRLRKESRTSANKRMFVAQPTTGPNTPIRPLPSAAPSYGSHSSGAEDGEPSAKRQRSSGMSVTYSSVPAAAHSHTTPHNAYGSVASSGGYAPSPYGSYGYGQPQYAQSFNYATPARGDSSSFMQQFPQSGSQASSHPYGSAAQQQGQQAHQQQQHAPPPAQQAYGGYQPSYGGYPPQSSSTYATSYASHPQSTAGGYQHDPYRSSMYAAGRGNLRDTEPTPRLPPIQSQQPGAGSSGSALGGHSGADGRQGTDS